MIIFNEDRLKDYNARLLDREISIVDSDRSKIWGDRFLKPIIGKAKFKWKKIKITIEFSGSTPLEIETNKSIIQDKLDNNFIRFDDLVGVRYFVVVDGESSISNNYHGRFQSLTFNLLGYSETDSETVIDLTGSSSVVMASELILDSPAIIEVSGNNSVIVEINDDKFEVGNIGTSTVTIGDGKVLKGTNNHWNDVEMTEFPKVKSGENIVKITPSTAKVRLRYRGRLR